MESYLKSYLKSYFEGNEKTQSLSKDSEEEIFKLPICFNSQVKILKQDIINDLELNKTILLSENETTLSEGETKAKTVNSETLELKEKSKPIYNHVFNPTNSLGNKILEIILYTIGY